MTNTRLFTLIILIALLPLRLIAAIDMQAHVGSDEGKAAYTDYIAEQNAYYTGDYAYTTLISLTNDALFDRLNERMGNTIVFPTSKSKGYSNLSTNYGPVDTDLNNESNIILFYTGVSIKSTWNNGSRDTFNKEHVWPKSIGAQEDDRMGHDMHAVRPCNPDTNSTRGNRGYAEIDDTYTYVPNTSYRGDCARIIMYDHITYGKQGTTLYEERGIADLFNQFGTNSGDIFESLHIMLKWHLQDPPSLTEMVRNDGAQDYQGNRNPLIDYPELAIQVFLDDGITTYAVTESSAATMWPAHRYTLSDGFIAYLTNNDGSHPQNIEVTGATSTYDKSNGRLTITNVTGNMTISDVAAATYTLTWNANGGQLSGTYTSGQVTPGTAITAPTATRSGYQFTGWSPTFTGTMPAANTTYIAQWQAQTIYTVTWMANGSVHTIQTYAQNSKLQLPTAPTPCAGYTFVGWTTEANYSNPFCAPGDIFTSATHKVTSNLTYYAVFKKN